jgi:hypothetical protein
MSFTLFMSDLKKHFRKKYGLAGQLKGRLAGRINALWGIRWPDGNRGKKF